jgi:hypothetical protein
MSKIDAATKAQLKSIKRTNCCTNTTLRQLVEISESTGVDISELLSFISPLERTPNLLRTSAAGSIPVACYDFSVFNAGLADGVLLGQPIRPGESLNFSAGSLNNIYPAGTVTYDGTGTELVIIYNS